MPQTFQVLRCYKCSVFQVHQMKKSSKFECKLCGEKQSIKRHYGLGTGKECRLHVQKLNGIRGNMDDLNKSLSTDDENLDDIKNKYQSEEQQLVKTEKESKWSDYIDNTEEDTNESVNNDMYLGDTEVVLEIPSKRRKLIRNKNKASYKLKNNDDLLESKSIEHSIIECKPKDISDGKILQSGIATTSKQTTRKKFVPPKCNKISKWAHYVDENNFHEGFHSDEDISHVDSKHELLYKENDHETFHTQRNVTINNFRSSTQTKTLCQSNPIRKNITNNHTQKLFSLCNDNDLDNILDI